MKNTTINCPLCAKLATVFFKDSNSCFYKCNYCELLCLEPSFRLSEVEEKARYELHENSPEDKHYRDFLGQLVYPLAKILPCGATGLDYGCGPGPTISKMLLERGFSVTNYDPFYFPQEETLKKTYDFITCTEVAEHFYYPAKEFKKLNSLLNHNGYLAIMTSPYGTLKEFENWHYRRDPTHVAFYNEKTFAYLSKTYNWTHIQVSETVTIFQKVT